MVLGYIIRRILQIIPLIIALTVIVFVIIQLPPGDFMTTVIQQMELSGTVVEQAEIQALRARFRLDRPPHEQYLQWITNIITQGDFGRSFQFDDQVENVIGERLGSTILVSFLALVFVWMVAIPVGIYSATHQYSLGDYIATFIGFIGLSVPGFLMALVVIYFVFVHTGIAISGLFSPEFHEASWSVARFLNMLPRLGAVIFIIGMQGTAGMIRTTRAMMLDELGKQYVITARAKGVAERNLLYKYPVRVAINPLISTVGWSLGALISGEVIVSIIFNMPTVGPMLFNALMFQDMFLAGSIVLLISTFTIIGTLLSDILLVILDPRIRFGGVAET